MDRALLEGVWIPRADLIGWKIEFTGGTTCTHDAPEPVGGIEIELDAVGCLTTGTVSLKCPRHPVFPGYMFKASVSLLCRRRGWVPVAQGFIPPAREDGREEWSLELRPLEELTMDGYADQAGMHSTLGAEPAEWNETQRSVVERILKRNPTASVGTDWAGRLVLARPEDGSPVRVSRAQFHGWKDTGMVTLPYLTAARWNGGQGWAKGEYRSPPRPPFTPARVQDAGEVTFEEVALPTGMPVVNRRELVVQTTAEGEEDTAGLAGLTLTTEGLKQPLGGGPFQRRVKANQYAAVVVLDAQAWYQGSALAGQDNEDVKALGDALSLAQKAYALAVGATGEASPLSQYEQGQLVQAQTSYRLARVEAGAVESTYEPLSALLPLGFEIHDADAGVVTGATIWASRVPWDEEAVGPPPKENPDPDAPLADGAYIEGPAIIHPFASENSMEVKEAPIAELTTASESKTYQMSQLKIPETWFRGPMGAKLGRVLDAAWREKYDPDDPPEDEAPPSSEWNGKWFVHVAVWWQAVDAPQRRVLHDWAEAATLERARLAAVTTGPLLRTVLTAPLNQT